MDKGLSLFVGDSWDIHCFSRLSRGYAPLDKCGQLPSASLRVTHLYAHTASSAYRSPSPPLHHPGSAPSPRRAQGLPSPCGPCPPLVRPAGAGQSCPERSAPFVAEVWPCWHHLGSKCSSGLPARPPPHTHTHAGSLGGSGYSPEDKDTGAFLLLFFSAQDH